MVNRRILRVKTLQALYGCEKTVEATFNLGLQYFDEVFNPVLFDEPDKELLSSQKDEGKKLYSSQILNGQSATPSDEFVGEKLQEAIESYEKNVAIEKRRYAKDLVSELDALYGLFISVYDVIVDLSRISEDFKRKNLGQNKVIKALKDSSTVQKAMESSTIRWSQHYDQVRGWFRDILNKDESYKIYEALESPTFDEDKQIILHIIKKVIFKNDLIQDFFEEQDLHWSENKSIVKSLATKSIKDVKESEEVLLRPISYNWDEDKEFFEELFSSTLKLEDELESIVAENSRNWEYERIASIDKIILRMALTEMIIFPSIPIKVTINEYLEIAKLYSTPKSKQFINGVLDITAKQLVEKGRIKKSGRGLIDNK